MELDGALDFQFWGYQILDLDAEHRARLQAIVL